MNKPAMLTTYDLLKTLAVILMIIDHVGYYFYPDDMWLRAIGRVSAPIWFFLIGYARSRDLSAPLWIGAAVLIVSSYVVGQAMLPLNILVTIILCRLFLDPLMKPIQSKPSALYVFAVLMAIGGVFTMNIVDYGTSAMLFVMFGYLVRHQTLSRKDLQNFGLVASGLYVALQLTMVFSFSPLQQALAALGILAFVVYAFDFKPKVYDIALPRAFTAFLQFCGRRSLILYVGHLLLFRFAALALGLGAYRLFTFHMM